MLEHSRPVAPALEAQRHMTVPLPALSGQRFGRLTVLSEASRARDASRQWLCRCDCGTLKVIRQRQLRSGRTRSCGCIRGDSVARHGYARRGQKPPEYRTWVQIHSRCNNPNVKGYANYGGRGIQVCSRWSGKAGFKNFLADMGQRPSDKHTIERKDVDGPYSPENCRWATHKEQGANTRRTRLVTYQGETLCISEWERRYGFPRSALQSRLRQGWSMDEALSTPITPLRTVTFRGETKRICEWAKITGLPRRTIQARLNLGWPAEKALTLPAHKGKHLKHR